MNEEAIEKIMRYVNTNLFEYDDISDKDQLRERSYARWAAGEILESLFDRPFDDAQTIVEEFLIKTDLYSCMASTEDAKKMFEIATEIAREILCII